VAAESSSAIALKSVAPNLPIVCLTLTDAGIPDLFASYARPGGNVTGMAQSVEGVTGKLVEVALEIIPGARRIGFLSNPRGASMPLFAESVDVAARARGMVVLTEQATAGGELGFRSIRQARGAGRHRASASCAICIPCEKNRPFSIGGALYVGKGAL
jgi:putative tryptophan/tyrosine transport system substrate-binding protein